MDNALAYEAGQLLLDSRKHGTVIDGLPSQCCPQSRIEGYQIQACFEEADARVGWKIAATSLAGQQHIGIDGPIAGRLTEEMVFAEDDIVPFGKNRMAVAEAEFVFQLGTQLPPRSTAYSMDEVMAAVSALYLGIELPDSRFSDFVTVGAPNLIADNACGYQFVWGPEASSSWRACDLSAHTISATVQSGADIQHYDGIGANVLGDPKRALCWLVNELSAHGITIDAGEIVTTGTCTIPMPITAGNKIIADFGVLGTVTCQLG